MLGERVEIPQCQDHEVQAELTSQKYAMELAPENCELDVLLLKVRHVENDGCLQKEEARKVARVENDRRSRAKMSGTRVHEWRERK